jgi:hypothetical protein
MIRLFVANVPNRQRRRSDSRFVALRPCGRHVFALGPRGKRTMHTIATVSRKAKEIRELCRWAWARCASQPDAHAPARAIAALPPAPWDSLPLSVESGPTISGAPASQVLLAADWSCNPADLVVQTRRATIFSGRQPDSVTAEVADTIGEWLRIEARFLAE